MHAVDMTGARLASSVSAAATLAWIMNSSISRCASSRSGVDHALDAALGVEHDLALGQVEVERRALIARLRQRPVGRPQRL